MDEIAEQLEKDGLYRRAATRWLDVLLKCNDDVAREIIIERRKKCLEKASCLVKRDSDVNSGSLRDFQRKVTIAHRRMGLNQDNGAAFRNYPVKYKGK